MVSPGTFAPNQRQQLPRAHIGAIDLHLPLYLGTAAL
jgi:hypothetical protein